MEAENPAILSDSDESVAPGQVSLLWARIHSLETQVWAQSRTISSLQTSQADESARCQVLSSLVQEIRSDLDSIKRLLQSLQGRIQRCEETLNLHSLD